MRSDSRQGPLGLGGHVGVKPYEQQRLVGVMQQLLQIGAGNGLSNSVSFLAAVTAVLSVLMIAACVRRWVAEYAGLGKTMVTIGVSVGVVAAYSLILVVWFWHMNPFPSAKNRPK
jgi:ABC-type Fe3+ transport system permease subunit